MAEAVAPGGVVGIFGGGQLGRMLAMAAARLGLKTHIFAPAGDNPALDVCHLSTIAAYEDEAAVRAFAQACDVVTLEFENLPLKAINWAAEHAQMRPGAQALEVSQDRWVEKSFLKGLGLQTAPCFDVASLDDLKNALAQTNGAGILKTRRFGYDGKGQARLSSVAEAEAAFETLCGAPAVLEGLAPFVREVSVIAARGPDGAFAAYDPAQNTHEAGILRLSEVPGEISKASHGEAVAIARKILGALDYVGVMGVELFELADGDLWVNEIAPRVHNSGHWTLEACVASQFEQHIRAVCGWPLADASRHSNAQMRNLLGDEVGAWRDLSGQAQTGFHHYGKSEARPGRKTGHMTTLTPLKA